MNKLVKHRILKLDTVPQQSPGEVKFQDARTTVLLYKKILSELKLGIRKRGPVKVEDIFKPYKPEKMEN